MSFKCNSVVLIANLVLWFGNELHCSLINPHQIRSHGYTSVCDDPWDPHRSLGIDLDGIFIPALLASGPNLFFESRVPTDWKMDTLPIIENTLQFGTQRICKCPDRFQLRSVLSTVYQPLRGMYGRNRRHICLRSQPLLTFAASPRSSYASQILVHVAPTGTTGANIGARLTSERHSSVTFENLSGKWNIGLETAKHTLQVTTQ